MKSQTTQSRHDQQVVAWQARRTDGSPLARWEDCTREAYDATVKTGRYLGHKNGPTGEARALCVAPSQHSGARVDSNALHPRTADLVQRFSAALAQKLAASERKHGYSDGWLAPHWMDECRTKLAEHVLKGDPRDVAAYCAFLWHHGEPTFMDDGALQNKVADAVRSTGHVTNTDKWEVADAVIAALKGVGS